MIQSSSHVVLEIINLFWDSFDQYLEKQKYYCDTAHSKTTYCFQ